MRVSFQTRPPTAFVIWRCHALSSSAGPNPVSIASLLPGFIGCGRGYDAGRLQGLLRNRCVWTRQRLRSLPKRISSARRRPHGERTRHRA